PCKRRRIISLRKRQPAGEEVRRFLSSAFNVVPRAAPATMRTIVRRARGMSRRERFRPASLTGRCGCGESLLRLVYGFGFAHLRLGGHRLPSRGLGVGSSVNG